MGRYAAQVGARKRRRLAALIATIIFNDSEVVRR